MIFHKYLITGQYLAEGQGSSSSLEIRQIDYNALISVISAPQK